MQTVALGQAFLIRRDLLSDLGKLQGEVLENSYHREDRPAPKKNIAELLEKFTNAMVLRCQLDLAIERANNLPDQVVLNENSMSLNEARKLKVGLTATHQSLTQMISNLVQMGQRAENEYVNEGGLNVPRVRRYTILLDSEILKAKAKGISKDIRSLDSLIQKADWSLQVEIPETDI